MLPEETKKNKQGQMLGRKGQETRARLMDAARRLLLTQSPVEITAVSIAAEANTSPASFYMYFDDTKDILFALSELAGQDMASIHVMLDEPWATDNLEMHTRKFTEAFYEVWAKHREILRFRNLEADRGDPRFEELRMNTYMPFIEKFTQRIIAVNPPQGSRKRGDIYAEASILHSAMERLATTDPAVMERGLGLKRVVNNVVRIIVLVMSGGQSNNGAAPAPKAAARKRAVKEDVVTGSAVKAAAATPLKARAAKPKALKTVV